MPIMAIDEAALNDFGFTACNLPCKREASRPRVLFETTYDLMRDTHFVWAGEESIGRWFGRLIRATREQSMAVTRIGLSW